MPSWLSDAVIYEIYPQSFKDSNGDGVGDIPGIIEKLDYVKSLGCDAIWLNPCFDSPFGDAGYDVRDFCKVAARYGTNEDLIRLFREAHARGMRVILDLVAGHTSVEHPWFQESQRHDKNPHSDYYVWTNSVWDGGADNFVPVRGSAERDGGYIANFFHFQPALNYGFAPPDPKCPWQQPVDAPGPLAVKREMREIMRFWLEAGCDGFRVDMAESLIKGPEKLAAVAAFWREMRGWFDREWPEAVLISEWSKPHEALVAGFHIDFLIHFGQSAYNSLFRAEKSFGEIVPGGKSFFRADGGGDITLFTGYYNGAYEATKDLGYISLPTGNHDILPRLADGRSREELRAALAFLFLMPGIPVIYQGDEIGMNHVQGLPSKEGGYGRTGSRTPMQWDGSPGAGFSSAPEKDFYLPLDPSPNRPHVAAQDTNPDSLLGLVRSLIRLRRKHPALGADGAYRSVLAEPGKSVFVFSRTAGSEHFLVAVNPGTSPAMVELPDWQLSRILVGEHAAAAEGGIRFEGAGFAVFEARNRVAASR